MIQKIRIDDRLLHGQVAYSWKSALNYEAIVIASDDAASDPIRKQALKLAKPDGVKPRNSFS
ncbi:PTS sugar transporter subunit IIB [Erysipelothrix piscisicarius]|uniref:PTS sugar transporter subunit IIB n=1 Tax=Erysipelothrix piscisicarius TaxID=2485784 RepID=UPI002F94FA68